MKAYTFNYDTKDKGISGSFARLLPTVEDLAAIIATRVLSDEVGEAVSGAESLEEQVAILTAVIASLPEVISQYWGWFRQVQVTLRAEAKRYRAGNDKTPGMSETEVKVKMKNGKLPVYSEPTESLTEEQKLEKLAKSLTPAQIAKFLAAAGISEIKANE